MKKLDRSGEPVSGCVWAADGQSFTTSSLDKNQSLRTYNLDGELLHDWYKNHRVQDLCGDSNWLIAVDDLHTIHVYNASTREHIFDLQQQCRPTSISISRDSQHLLVNRTDGEAQLVNLITRATVQKYRGHTGGECLIRNTMGGANETFVLSGSEGEPEVMTKSCFHNLHCH